jgi:hypothetical protein
MSKGPKHEIFQLGVFRQISHAWAPVSPLTFIEKSLGGWREKGKEKEV